MAKALMMTAVVMCVVGLGTLSFLFAAGAWHFVSVVVPFFIERGNFAPLAMAIGIGSLLVGLVLAGIAESNKDNAH